MSKELPFLIYCMEEYKAAKRLSGRQVAELFSKRKVMDFIFDFYESLHVIAPHYIIEDIDEYIASAVS